MSRHINPTKLNKAAARRALEEYMQSGSATANSIRDRMIVYFEKEQAEQRIDADVTVPTNNGISRWFDSHNEVQTIETDLLSALERYLRAPVNSLTFKEGERPAADSTGPSERVTSRTANSHPDVLLLSASFLARSPNRLERGKESRVEVNVTLDFEDSELRFETADGVEYQAIVELSRLALRVHEASNRGIEITKAVGAPDSRGADGLRTQGMTIRYRVGEWVVKPDRAITLKGLLQIDSLCTMVGEFNDTDHIVASAHESHIMLSTRNQDGTKSDLPKDSRRAMTDWLIKSALSFDDAYGLTLSTSHLAFADADRNGG